MQSGCDYSLQPQISKLYFHYIILQRLILTTSFALETVVVYPTTFTIISSFNLFFFVFFLFLFWLWFFTGLYSIQKQKYDLLNACLSEFLSDTFSDGAEL